jgi:hypothetical protein
MTRSLMIGSMLALGLATLTPEGKGQVPGTPRSNDRNPTTQIPRQPATPELKAVFWYDRADPSATLKAKVYDLRRGQYDQAAVERWLKSIKADFPAYMAFERSIHLANIPGEGRGEDRSGARTRVGADRRRVPAPVEQRPIRGPQDERDRAREDLRARPDVKHRLVLQSHSTQEPPEQGQAVSQSGYKPMDLSKLLYPGGTPR